MNLWLCLVGTLLTFYVIIGVTVRPSVAIGAVLPFAWIVPVWCGFQIGPEFVNVRTGVAIGMLVLYAFFPRASFPWRLMPCDFAVLTLVAVHVASDLWNSEPTWMLPLVAYCEWILPYLCGRLALQGREDIAWLWPSLAIAAMILGVLSVFEAWTSMNPYEWGAGLRPYDNTYRDVQRWNLRRAYAVCLHPLYNGVLLCWFFAWLAHPALRALAKRSSPIWLFPPIFGFIAPLTTGSRGPFLGNMVILLTILFCIKQKWRVGIVIALCVTAALFAANQDRIFTMLDDWSGEFERGRQSRSVTFDERSEKVSSARARLTLFKIYKAPLLKAGILGFGTESVAGFPVNVPLGSDEAEAAKAIWSLDNEYLLITLRFGYAGLGCFVAIIGLALWQLIRVYDSEPVRSQAIFAAALCGATFAVSVLLVGVWMPLDFGFAWLWGIGASSGLYYGVQAQAFRKHRDMLAIHPQRIP